jgi:hypothetical protein
MGGSNISVTRGVVSRLDVNTMGACAALAFSLPLPSLPASLLALLALVQLRLLLVLSDRS